MGDRPRAPTREAGRASMGTRPRELARGPTGALGLFQASLGRRGPRGAPGVSPESETPFGRARRAAPRSLHGWIREAREASARPLAKGDPRLGAPQIAPPRGSRPQEGAWVAAARASPRASSLGVAAGGGSRASFKGVASWVSLVGFRFLALGLRAADSGVLNYFHILNLRGRRAIIYFSPLGLAAPSSRAAR
jgi:hypothetical protein